MRKGYKVLLIGVFIGIYLFLTAWICVPLIKAWPLLSPLNQVIGELPDLKPIMALYKNPLLCLLELRDGRIAISWLVISLFIAITMAIWVAWERWNERVLHPTEKKTKRPKVRMPNHTADATAIGVSDNCKPIYVPDNARHVFVAGTTGSGKTIVLSNFVENGLAKGYGMLVIDGKGDTGSGSLLDYCRLLSIRYGRRIHIIGGPSSNKYNPFRNAKETEAKDMLISMTDWSEPHYRANTERYVQSLIHLLFVAGIPLSYDVVIENMSKTAYETLSAQLVREKKTTKEDHIANLAISAASSDITASATARFATIAEGEGNSIFSADGIDVYTALSKGDIIFFCLSPLIYPSFASSLGRLAVLDARKAVSRMWGDHKPKLFIFDELGAYISPMFVTLLSQARAATVTCITATQSFADLDMVSTSLRRQVVENCNSFVMMRQNSPEDAQQAADIIGTHEDMDITYQLNEQRQTGLGSARKVRQYFFHPDVIKNLCVGEAVFVSKETGQRTKLWVRKPE
jgi:hypothetical protein